MTKAPLLLTFALCGAAILPAPAAAEFVSGSVLNAATMQPVARATVTAGGKKTTTNGAGGFVIDGLSPGPVQVQVSAPGYEPAAEPAKIPAGGLSGVVVVLFPIGFAGELIQVEGKTRPLQIDPPGRQDLGREEIVRIPGSRGDPLQTLRNLPGVSSASGNGPGASDLVIRGSAPEDTVIMLDGIEVPLVYHFFGVQSVLPGEFIERIDFLPGGFDVDRGRATGGVVEVKTRSQEPEDYSGFAELSFINLAGLVQGPLSKRHKLYLTAAVRRSTIDWILPAVIPEDAEVSFTTAPTYYDSQLRLDWRPRSTDQVALLALYSFDELKLINDSIDPNEPLLTGTFRNNTQFSRLIATWKHKSNRTTSTLSASGGITDFTVELPGDRFIRLFGPRFDVREDFALSVTDHLRLRAGGDARLATADIELKLPLPPHEGEGGPGNYSTAATLELDDKLTNHAAAAYVAADLRPFPSTTLTSGVRLDYYHHIDETTWSPRVSVKQQLTPALGLQASVGNYSRPLDQNEALQTNLLPERATQYVLGAEYQLFEGVQTQLSGFYTDRRDLVVQDPVLGDTDPDNAYVNRGYGRSFGSELMVRARTDDFFGWVSYTLSRSDRIDGPGQRRRLFDYDQTHNFILVGSYKLGSWQFGGRFQYTTGLPTTPVAFATYLADFNVHVPTYGVVNSQRFRSNHQLDLRVDKIWSWDTFKLSAYLDITNVYAHPAVLAVDYNFNYTEMQEIKDIPILPAIGIRGSWQ